MTDDTIRFDAGATIWGHPTQPQAVIISDTTGREMQGHCPVPPADGRATIDLGGLKVSGRLVRYVPAAVPG